MTLRESVQIPPEDELGGLIRWALRKRVAGATPAPEVWGRIRERVERNVTPGRQRFDFTPFLRALFVWVSADVCCLTFVAQPAQRSEAVMWGYNTPWVLGQHQEPWKYERRSSGIPHGLTFTVHHIKT